MKTLIIILIVFPFCSLAQNVESNSNKKIKFDFADAIEHFILEAATNNYPINDTLVIFNLDKSVIASIPKKIQSKYLKFVSFEEIWDILSAKDTVQAYQIWTTKFESSLSFVFLPLKISKDEIIRDYNNICGVSYYLNKKTRRLEYDGMHCGSGLKIEN